MHNVSLPPYPFGDRLAEHQHPVSHVLFIIGAELQWGALCQDDLEGMGTLCAVRATAASTMLSADKE